MAERDRPLLVAATSRVVLGVFAVTLLPLVYPGLEAHRALLAGYVAIACLMLFLIWKDIGGLTRAVTGGVIDLLVLTFIVHRVGSAATMMASIYFFAAIVNTLVVGRRVGVMLAVLSATLYCGVVIAEGVSWLPYGPDAPHWARTGPHPFEALILCVLISVLLVASAALVGMLVQRIRTREAQLVEANARLSELSVRDPLTQLFNRRYLMSRLDAELARARRGTPLCVIMIDLDGFKRVNDEKGHERGDEVLRTIATSLAAATREVDVPGRYGGDEFLILLPSTAPAQAALVGERLVEAVRQVGRRFDAERPVTASAGIACARVDDEARGLIRRADERAYVAKQAGGDRACDAPERREAEPGKLAS